tara:strand:- start:75 stop:647 length:573 start_codon:yes stop_codon:yes gene_type:complete
MNKFWEKVEHYNARLIPLAIVALLAIIIIELFFKEFAHHHHTAVAIADGFVIAIFVVDLTFLAIKAKSTKFFFKNYWLDIFAIFPFNIFFNTVTKLYRTVLAAEKLIIGQAILHEGLEARKGISAAARGGRIARGIRIVARSIRVVTKSRLFTEFKAKHHLAKRNHKKGKKARKVNKKISKKRTSSKKRR